MVLEQAIQPIRYVSHFDEFTWIPGIIDRKFFELRIEYNDRAKFLQWLVHNCCGSIYVWNGVVTPSLGDSNWGHKIAPDEETAFLVFEDAQDETRFTLEFVGNPVGLNARIHHNGFSAYHSRKSK
jgi:hypothetical protein